jgi:hypothetical protein
VLEGAEHHVGRHELDGRALADPGQRRSGRDPQRLAVREVERPAGGEDVAAAGPQPGERESLEGSAVHRLERDLRPLRSQLAVPDHLREADRHREAPGVDPQAVGRLRAQEREVEAGVARVVVVAQQRQHGQERGVALGAVDEVAADAEEEPVDPDLQPRPQPSQGAIGLDERDGIGPLLPEEAVDLHLDAVPLALLIHGVGILGRGERGGSGERGEQEGAFHERGFYTR